MGWFREMTGITVIHFHQWKKDYRVWLILLFTALLIGEYLKGFTLYAWEEGKSLTPCMLPLIYISSEISFRAPKVVWNLGFLLLLCDAPFLHPATPYMILRSRRRNWWRGECLYIICVAFIYMSFLALVSALLAFPSVEWGNEWGNGLSDFIFGSEGITGMELYGLHEVGIFAPEKLIKYLYPAACEGYTFFSGFLTFCVFGLTMYFISICQNKKIFSIGIPAFWVLLDPVLTLLARGDRYWLQSFSPACWTSVEDLNFLGENRFLNINYIFPAYIGLIVLLLILIGRRSRKYVIEVKR